MTKPDWITNDPEVAAIMKAADAERKRIAATPATLVQKLKAIAAAIEARDKALANLKG